MLFLFITYSCFLTLQKYAVATSFSSKPLMQIERAAARKYLSVCHFSVFVNFFYIPPPPQLPVTKFFMGGVYIGIILPVCPDFSRRYFLNYSTFCKQIWYCGILSRDSVSCRKICLFSLRSCKVTVWLIQSKYDCFFFYPLNCWSFCNQAWFGGTLS